MHSFNTNCKMEVITVKTRKIKKPCNICKTEDYLTRDHVPPQCCSNKGNVNFYRLFDTNIDPNKKPGQFQKGIYFKTLCSKCNNEYLGKEFDPYLGDFQNNIIDAVSKCTKISDAITIKCKINKICRAVIGHLLAALPFFLDGGIENDLRKYFFDKAEKQIKNQHLYIWISNEKRVAMARNIGIALDPIFNGAMISLLKFPGAAFMLCDKYIDDNLVDLFDYTSRNIEDEIEVKMELSSIYSRNGEARITEWPLIVNDNRIFVLPPEIQNKSMFSTLLDI